MLTKRSVWAVGVVVLEVLPQHRREVARSETMEAAFDRLRRHACSHNLLLGDVARRVVAERGFARQILNTRVG